MKIAVYCDLLPGGAYRATEEMLKRLKKHHQIDIYHGPLPFPTPPFLKRLFIDLESIVFQYFKQKNLAQKIDSQKYDLVFVTHDFHIHSPWILRFLKTPTVFLSQEPTRAFYEKFLFIESCMPLLNRIYETINRKIRKSLEERNVTFASTVVTSSCYSCESVFRAYGVDSLPVYPGIDPTEYHPQKTAKKNQITIVGNNEPQKDLFSAVKVVSLINKDIRPKLIILSPRPTNMSKVRAYARRLKVAIDIKTSLDQKEMCLQYNNSLLTIAVAHLEPFGLSIIESLACGTPVVVVNEGGFRETVIQNKTGVLVDRDYSKMADAIGLLIQNKDKLRIMGENGEKDVNKRFTWDNTVSKLEEIFYETAQTKSRGHNSKLQ